MSNESRFEQIKQRCSLATPGPWKRDRNWFITGPDNDWEEHWFKIQDLKKYDGSKQQIICKIDGPGYGNNAAEDGHFIANARQDIPYLLEQIALRDRALERAVRHYIAPVGEAKVTEEWWRSNIVETEIAAVMRNAAEELEKK